MPRQGHKLTITPAGQELIATCQCGNWRRTVPLSGDQLMNLVGILTGKHDRHLERLGRSTAGDGSADDMPALPDEPSSETPPR